MLTLLDDLVNHHSYIRGLNELNQCAYTCISLAFNRATPDHKDDKESPGDFVVMISLGDAKGADLHLPGLGVILPFELGTMILLRGAEVRHFVNKWEKGQRISSTMYIPKSIWVARGMTYPWRTADGLKPKEVSEGVPKDLFKSKPTKGKKGGSTKK